MRGEDYAKPILPNKMKLSRIGQYLAITGEQKIKIVVNQRDAVLYGENYESHLAAWKVSC